MRTHVETKTSKSIRPHAAPVPNALAHQAQLRQALLRAGVQPRLEIGSSRDPLEREADEAARRVMCMSTPETTPVLDTPKQANLVQAKDSAAPATSASPQLESSLNSLSGGGTPMDAQSRAFFEPRFGQDFSQVRLHTDERAAHMAKALGAKAFTLGKDIAFGANQYSAHTSAGRNLLAHELAHVVQQNGVQQNGVQQNGVQQNGAQQNGAQQNGAQQNGVQQNGAQQQNLNGSAPQAKLLQRQEAKASEAEQGDGWFRFLTQRIGEAIAATELEVKANLQGTGKEFTEAGKKGVLSRMKDALSNLEIVKKLENFAKAFGKHAKKLLGPAALAVDAGIGVYNVSQASPEKKVEVAFNEVGSIGGGLFGAALGALTVKIVAALALALGVGLSASFLPLFALAVFFAVIGGMAGKEVGKWLYQKFGFLFEK